MPRLSVIRLAAVLVPASLLLHESVYALAGGLVRSSHDYLTLLLPVVVVVAMALAMAALLLPALGFGSGEDRIRSRPFLLALALIALFAIQEGSEAVLFGGGVTQLAAAIAAGWALLPVALALGALGAGILELIERAGLRLAELLLPRRPRPPLPRDATRPAALLRLRTNASSPLAFGIACRPPPSAA